MTAKQKTVVIVTPYFPPYGGGLERYAYEIATRLRQDHGWRVVIITSGEQFGEDIKEDAYGFTLYRLAYDLKVSNTPFSFGWFGKVKKILRIEDPDVVNIHMPVPGIGDVAASLSGKRRVVLTYHAGSMRKGKLVPDLLIWLYEKFFLRMALNRADTIVCSSDYVRLEFLQHYFYKSTTITPAVDSDLFRPGKQSNRRPTLLFVAGLKRSDQHKGLKTLMAAFGALRDSFPELQLVVVGEGNMKSEYQAHAKHLGLQDRIIFMGKLTGKELAEVYRQSSIFVLPSLAPAESFGMVLIEAMATGKPVIGTTAGGIPRVIDHEKNGLLTESGNVQSLASAIKRLLDDPVFAEQLGEAGRQKALSQYDWDVQVATYDAVLENSSASKIAIVQVVGYFPPHIGGMEIVVQEISRELARRAYPLRVLTSDIGAECVVDTGATYPITRMRSSEIAHTPIMWSLPLRLFCLPKRSILHIHISQAGLPEIAVAMAKMKHIPVVAHFHLDVGPSGSLGALLPLYKRFFLGPALRAADTVIVFSEKQAEAMRVRYRIEDSRIAIIPNGVSEDFFYRRKKVAPSDRLRLLYVGRLSAQKRVERLIEAMALAKIPVSLSIVGDGEERPMLEMLTRKLKLANVSFEGKKSREELGAYYRAADALVISSDIEGMPLTILEAMAEGLPIVGSNVPGIAELISGVGVLVSAPYPEAFAAAFAALWNTPGRLRALSVKSMEKAKQYSWTKLIDQLEDVYNQIHTP
jgi:phosphatidylinositol alpha-mannosyltransferase